MFGGRKPQSTPVSPQDKEPATGQSLPATMRQPSGYETVLGANSTFKGELKSDANVRIDGNFEGSLDIKGTILVGETARIVANIQARNEVKIAGAVRGNVNGRKVHLARTGRVWGDINASALQMDEGSFVDGKVTMTGHPAGTQGFGPALPAPEVTILPPMEADASEPEMVDAELMDDDRPAGEHAGDSAPEG